MEGESPSANIYNLLYMETILYQEEELSHEAKIWQSAIKLWKEYVATGNIAYYNAMNFVVDIALGEFNPQNQSNINH